MFDFAKGAFGFGDHFERVYVRVCVKPWWVLLDSLLGVLIASMGVYVRVCVKYWLILLDSMLYY